ncbi:cytochrome b6f complex, Rieske iron-sulfur subunit [Candidatus Sulfotelmatomonas gaucii]|uniref:Cytochrome b6f complex, Rieske iron-sulfur subunit n=1 Tax=Candidatus Sulfuritelmatomonas gaucii TaxID=2043161 RepID=A0A2N9L7G6_9BACT|nr:cytochrome b6f complex, Rieske iron-sulfur subunit [Candidatus Sulfotelmatomonas gaucii]
MPDESQAATPKLPTEFDRRAFFTRVGLRSLGIAAAGTIVFTYEFLSPNVLFEPSPIVNLGKPDSFAVNSVTMDVNTAIYLVRAEEGFFALSEVCTHLGCLTAWNQDLGIIVCPCHGSKFTRTGEKIEGPAPKPLPWLKTWVSDDGDLLVDRSANIPPLQYLRI